VKLTDSTIITLHFTEQELLGKYFTGKYPRAILTSICPKAPTTVKYKGNRAKLGR
jgi:hypothetical protein